MIFAAIVLAVAVAALGGSARYDASQLMILQPLAILVMGFCAMKLTARDWIAFRLPLILFGCLALLMILQLVTLPHGLWTAMPGRDVVADIDTALGVELARPLSLVPSRTLNALFGLAIPLAALLTFLAIDPERRRSIVMLLLIVIAMIHALVGMLQLLGPPDSWVYFYRISNFGQAVGLFSNANHAAVFASLMMIVMGYLLATGTGEEGDKRRLLLLAAGFAFVFILGLLSGSRLGLITSVIALLTVAAAFFWRPEQRGKRLTKKLRMIVGGAFILGIVAIAVLFFAADRIPALGELMATSPMDDMRVRLLGPLLEIAGGYFPVGSGFGTFENVYYIAEPDSELQPTYLNMAHNDWVQFMIEAGLPGIVILLGALWWIVRLAMRLAGDPARRPALLALVGGVLIILLASLFDYPLRAPLFQFACVWLLASLWDITLHNSVAETGE